MKQYLIIKQSKKINDSNSDSRFVQWLILKGSTNVDRDCVVFIRLTTVANFIKSLRASIMALQSQI